MQRMLSISINLFGAPKVHVHYICGAILCIDASYNGVLMCVSAFVCGILVCPFYLLFSSELFD